MANFFDKIVGNPERRFSQEGRQRRMMGGFDRAMGQTGQFAGQGAQQFLARSLAFDPSQAVTTYGQGFMDEATEQLGKSFEGLTGSAVGSGRMRTGFFQKDAGNMFQDFNRRVANAIAAQSMNAARMDMQNTQNLGAFGQNMMGQYTDILSGGLSMAQAEENARTSPWDVAMQAGGAAAGLGWNPFGGGGGGG